MPVDPDKPPQPPAIDPKQLVLVTPGVNNEYEKFFLNNAFPHANKVVVSGTNFIGDLQSRIEKQVREAGNGKLVPLTQVTIDTHGSPGKLFVASQYDRHPVSMNSTLDAIQNLQDKIRKQPGADPNFKVADRIVITGCDVFAHLSDDQIQAYSEKAKKLGIDIVGSADEVIVYRSGNMDGRYAKFGKDGSITHDKYDSGPASAEKQQIEPYPGGDSWIDCYAGKDLKTGATCRDAPANLSNMFRLIGTSALEHGTPEQRKLAADMKTIVREYDGGTHSDPNDGAQGKEIRKLAEDTGKGLADYLKGHPDPKLVRHLTHDYKTNPGEVADWIEKQVNASKLDRLSQSSGITNTNTASISAGTIPGRPPTSANIYAGGPSPQDNAIQHG